MPALPRNSNLGGARRSTQDPLGAGGSVRGKATFDEQEGALYVLRLRVRRES